MKSKYKITVLIVLLAIVLIVIFRGASFGGDGESNASVPEEWKTAESNGLIFKYPEEIPAKYIHPVDWPPQAQIIDEEFSCTEAGEPTARAGRTQMRIIGGQNYCVTEVTEGAAGSIYTQYAYAFPIGDETAILTFSLRFLQCGNYPETEMRACQTERDSFNIDNLVDEISSTINR